MTSTGDVARQVPPTNVRARRLARWIRIVLCLMALLLLYRKLPGITDRLAEASFGNAIPAADSEAPVTVWSPAWSTAELGALVGRGEGLDCSIPSAALNAFASDQLLSGSELAPVNLRFRQACVAHDLCYRHGRATYGYTQSQCDAALAAAAFRLCRMISRNGASRDACTVEARKVLAGVTLGGTDSYRPASLDGRRLGSSEIRLDRISTTAEYDPYPQGSAQFALPRIGRGDCLGHPNTPVLVTIARRPGGSEINKRCYDGKTFILALLTARAPPTRTALPAPATVVGTPASNTASAEPRSEYSTVVSMPWLNASGGLTRWCRNEQGGTTFGFFASSRDALSYSGCRTTARSAFDPDVVTMFPVPGRLSEVVPALGFALPDRPETPQQLVALNDDPGRLGGCTGSHRGPRCYTPLPAQCRGSGSGEAYRWFAEAPLVLPRADGPAAVTLFSRGCGRDRDYQTLLSVTAHLDGSGWLGDAGRAFGPAATWWLPEGAEPFVGIGTADAPALLSLRVLPDKSVARLNTGRAIAKSVTIACAVAAFVALLLLTRVAAAVAIALAVVAALSWMIANRLDAGGRDGFTQDARLEVYRPGRDRPAARPLPGMRPWLQQRMPVVVENGRVIVVMPRVDKVGSCGGGGLCLDVWMVAQTSTDTFSEPWQALRQPLPARWACRAIASHLLLVPFRDATDRLHLLALSPGGNQAIFASSQRPSGLSILLPTGTVDDRPEAECAMGRRSGGGID